MGIRDHPIAPRSPWQNAYVEQLIGSIRRECLDHMIVFGEAHLRGSYADMPPIIMRRDSSISEQGRPIEVAWLSLGGRTPDERW